MTKFISSTLLFAFAAIALVSCSGGVECTVEDFNSKVQGQNDVLNSAIEAYNIDPTDDNCNKVKDEANDYIDLLNDFQDCEELSGSDIDALIATTRTLLGQIPCN